MADYTSKVILLSGWKGSGKSTVASYLQKELGYEEVSIASPLKDLVAKKYNIPRSHLDSPTLKEQPIRRLPWNMQVSASMSLAIANEFGRETARIGRDRYWTPRLLCIMEGAIARAVDPEFWIEKALEEMDYRPGHSIVIPDIRYPNEIEAIKKVYPDTQIIRISRHEEPSSLDPSETSLDGRASWDAFIDNSGTIEDLHRKINGLRKQGRI